jgi:hypothetical protein
MMQYRHPHHEITTHRRVVENPVPLLINGYLHILQAMAEVHHQSRCLHKHRVEVVEDLGVAGSVVVVDMDHAVDVVDVDGNDKTIRGLNVDSNHHWMNIVGADNLGVAVAAAVEAEEAVAKQLRRRLGNQE